MKLAVISLVLVGLTLALPAPQTDSADVSSILAALEATSYVIIRFSTNISLNASP